MNRITNRIDSNRELECSSGHRRKHTRTEARTDRRTTRKHNAICKLVGDTTTTTITIAIRNWQQKDGEGKAFSAAARIQSGPKITEVALFFLFLLFGNTLLLTIFLLTLSVSSPQNTIRGFASQMQSAMCRSDGRMWRSHRQHRTIAQGLSFSDAKDLREIRPESPPTRAPNAGEVCQNRRLSTNSRLYLENGTR